VTEMMIYNWSLVIVYSFHFLLKIVVNSLVIVEYICFREHLFSVPLPEISIETH